ncbi:acyltransferase [Thermodesulfobacteriota bacterium]
MIDYINIEVTRGRFKDKASNMNVSIKDRIRTSWALRDNKHIKHGKNIVFKKNVDIRICETGKLTIGNNCLFDDYSMLLLTMPNPEVSFGDWVVVNRNTCIAAKNRITIGSYTIIAPYCYIIDHEHGHDKDNLILNQKSVLKEVIIGRDCWLGTGVKVLGGAKIGDGTIIGAGSVVSSDIPPNQVWAGVPARYIKDR